MKNTLRTLKVLCIGNSFAVDTVEHVPVIVGDLGISEMHIANLYIGGCSINRHFDNAQNDTPGYRYDENTGSGWRSTPNVSIREAIGLDRWDWISIQHGTGDGSRYTVAQSYENLPALIAYVKAHAHPDTKIAFNMAWAMEPEHTHPDILAHGGDQLLTYRAMATLTAECVAATAGLDAISPTGTAIQNARTTALVKHLSRDGFHLSYGIGRYIAGLTFVGALTGVTLQGLQTLPEGVSEAELPLAIAAATAALQTPFAISQIG